MKRSRPGAIPLDREQGPLENLAGLVPGDAPQCSVVGAVVAGKWGRGGGYWLGLLLASAAQDGWWLGNGYAGSGELQAKSTGCASRSRGGTVRENSAGAPR